MTQAKVVSPLINVFGPGILLSGMSTGSLPAPLWIGLALVLDGLLVSLLLFVVILKSVRQAKQAQKNSGAGSAS